MADPAVWDKLDQPWDNTTGWTSGGTGESGILPAGQLYQKATGSGTAKFIYADIGDLPDDYTAEFLLCVNDFASGGYAYHDFYDGVHRYGIEIYTDKVKNTDSAINFTLTTTPGTWYVWRVVIDSSGHSFKVYRKTVGGAWSYIGELAGGLNYILGDGMLYVLVGNAAGQVNALIHEDYFKIASGLYEPALGAKKPSSGNIVQLIEGMNILALRNLIRKPFPRSFMRQV